MSKTEMKPGEWLFRLLAFCATLVLYTVIGGLVAGAFVYGALSFDEGGLLAILSFFGYVLTPVVCWIIIVVMPLAREGQTIGLKLFGLKVVSSLETRANSGQIVLRESLQLILVGLLVGIVGLLWIFLDGEGRTLFDRITRTRVIQTPAKLDWVNEFRQFRAGNSSPASE
jgi:uncharacterized RDD family membrane protein YckC